MKTHTVIIHGWSDCSDSFAKLKQFLEKNGFGAVGQIFYADYESREDNLTFPDVADGLNDEFIRRGFITVEGKPLVNLNVIVHSTGGLVIRHWVSRYYAKNEETLTLCPVKRIVMLAPANFGSPLAHRGKSFLGRLFKGRWKIGDLLEVGRRLLTGLELASPYQWSLAHQDVLSGVAPYKLGQIQVTILVGIKDYDKLRGWVNKPGTDGTVVISGTSMNTIKLTLDGTSDVRDAASLPYKWSSQDALGVFAWAVIQGVDHGSIVDAAAEAGTSTSNLLLKALHSSGKNTFEALCKVAAETTAETYRVSRKPKYQQFLIRAIDDQGSPVPDFTLEFFILRASRASHGITSESRPTNVELDFSRKAQGVLSAEFHTHSVDASYRRFLVDVSELKRLLAEAASQLGQAVTLSMKVYVPRVDRGIYYAVDQLQNVVLHETGASTGGPAFLYENTTTLLEIQVNRANTYITVGLTPRKH